MIPFHLPDTYIGTIAPTIRSASSLPNGWLPCDGSAIDGKYDVLLGLVGKDGRTPNLIGRTLLGVGDTSHARTDQQDGNNPHFEYLPPIIHNQVYGGEAGHQLTTNEIPAHNHKVNKGQLWLHYQSFSGADGSDRPFKNSKHHDGDEHVERTEDAGDSGLHNNVQPYFAVNYMIYAGDVKTDV